MADGGEQPFNQELFEQQDFEQEPQEHQPEPIQEPDFELQEQNQQNEHFEAPVAEAEPMDQQPAHRNFVDMDDDDVQIQNHHMNQNQNYYDEDHLPQPPPGDLFQPAAYVLPDPGETRDARFDANADTIWIDSDEGDEEALEEERKKNNFYLVYNDHSYDPWDPLMRINLPQEGPFPICHDLTAKGECVFVSMPPGYDHLLQEMDFLPLPQEQALSAAARVVDATTQVQQAQQTQQELYQPPPPRRPVNSAAPYSVGGVEYQEQPRIASRGLQTRDQSFRGYNNEFNNPMMPPTQRTPLGRISNASLGGPRVNEVYQPRSQPRQAPQQPRMNIVQPTPGSYQHLGSPMPNVVGGQRRPNPQLPRGVSVGPGIMSGRPVGRSLPQQRIPQENPEILDQMPLPPVRRIQETAPHRLTDDQRRQQQALAANRPRPFLQARVGEPARQGTVIAKRAEELLRSPQRIPVQPVLEPRRFQVKVTDTYSTPIPKASDQLPAQLTEDPDEPSTSSAVPQEPEVAEPEVMEQEEPEKSPIKSPIRVPSAVSSPIKQAQKPTPPHRLTQEEKSAHFAKLATDKEKPAQASSSQHHHVPPPLSLRHHQEDPLAVVQSAFDPSKPREPDTPRDKEEISKIADELRFSADKFTVQGVGQRQRTISGGQARGQPYQMHPHHQQPQIQQQMDLMAERKRLGSGRFDNMSLQGQQIPPHLRNVPPLQEPTRVRHPEAGMEPPHRQRGRPRGSTGPQRQRFPSGTEPAAPQRGAGGARTIPPRQDRNGVENQSGSESEGEEESWVMRCHCGMDHGEGDTIECESCKTWQHMGCMGLSQKSDTRNYKCELCSPRKLTLSKQEAVKIQKKVLEKIIKATEKDKKNKRKSDPMDSKRPVQQPSTSRKSAPMALQPASIHPQLNEYSKAAAQLLSSMHQTAGADTLLHDSRVHKKARRMFVEENVEALVTTEVVAIRQVILEVNGNVTMAHEAKRPAGGGNCVFMYDGLMKGTAGEEMGDGNELVCIDAKKKGNDTKYTRRSCTPNCVLKHVLGSQATLGIMIVATKDIHRNTEVTLPFDNDWRLSDQVLQCADHMKQIKNCQYEQERAALAKARFLAANPQEREMEEARKADEERHRLEEEVRRERAVRTRQLEEEAEKERIEQEKAKKAEREEARKKKEAEKKKEMEEKMKKEEEEKEKVEKEKTERRKEDEKKESERLKAQEEEEMKKLPGGCSRTSEVVFSAREERLIKQSEERFRRQEEEQKKKEAQKAKADARAKSQTPEDSGPSTSDDSVRRRQSSRKQKRRDSQTSELEMDTLPGGRGNKRNNASSTSSPAPAPKRSLLDVADAFLDTPANRKRATSSAQPTSAKRSKGLGFKAGDIGDSLIANAEIHTKHAVEFMLPAEYLGEPVSEWVRKMKTPETKKQFEREQREQDEIYRKKVDKELKERKKALEREIMEAQMEKERVAAEKEEKEEEAASSSTPKAPEAPESSIKAPESPIKSPKAPESSTKAREASPAPPKLQKAPESTPKAPEAPQADREASLSTEGSVEKEIPSSSSSTPAAPEKKQKKISFEEYSRRKQNKNAEGASSSTATPSSSSTPSAAPRRGFIPSTEGLVNVQLSAIPLDNHMNSTTTTTTTAPSAPPPPPPPPPPVASPSTRSARARGAPSESDEAPAEHQIPLSDRITGIFGITLPTTSTERNNSTRGIAALPPPPPPRARNRPSRWNEYN